VSRARRAGDPERRGRKGRLARLLFRAALGRRLPRTRGRIAVPGPEGEVRIRRDGWGVPHIDAGSDADAWFGAGFCQGQDRGFQIEMLSRVVRGTLSELVGGEGIAVDRLSRRIGFLRSARRRLAVMDPGLVALIEAYTRGVMRGAREGSRRKPHELALLRGESGPFEPADVAGILALLSFALASNWDSELARLEMLVQDGREALEALDVAYPAYHPVTDPPGAPYGEVIGALARDLDALATAVTGRGGSNNWAISPSRTATGRPLVACDPHLTAILPPHWYLAHVRTPEWEAAGAAFTGTIGITVGHNGALGWGITAGLTDNTDLYLEEVAPDGRTVRGPLGPEPCEVIREVIRVRGGDDIVEEVLVTPRGPILWQPEGARRWSISMRAVWLDPLPLRGFLEIHRARSPDAIRAAFAEWPLLPLNLVFASADGSIGWELVGAAPVRARGTHLVPRPAWDPDARWTGLVPPSAMPRALDPACGFLATANNAPIEAGREPWLGADWLDGYRAKRIIEVLDSRRDWDVDGALRLQVDTFSIPWRDMRGHVLRAKALDARAGAALELLSRWDGDVTSGSAAASVFEVFCAEITRRLVEARAPRSSPWALGKGATPVSPRSSFLLRSSSRLARLLAAEPPGWFEKPWTEVVSEAISAAASRLAERCGPDPARWAWGRARALRFRHPFGQKAAFSAIFDRGPYPSCGDTNTVAQASLDLFDPFAGPMYTASLRAVMDVGRWERSRFVLPGGQSGNPLSPHYDDQLPLYFAGGGIPIPWTEEEVASAAREELVLVPV